MQAHPFIFRHQTLKKAVVTILAVCVTAATPVMARQDTVDRKLPIYQETSGVSGNLNSVGSDTLNNLMAFWAEAFQQKYPNVRIQIEGKGSSTAPPALIAGTAQLGPMSRKMKSSELDKFEKKYGFKPVAIGVALDSLAVYVNKDNPIDSMILPQVDAVFSKTRRSGYSTDITRWSDLGVGGELGRRPISIYGRNSASGTYGYFKKHALFKGDYRDTVKEQPGSASVVMGVTEDKAGIGYSGIGYRTSGVRAIPLARKKGAKAYAPTVRNVLLGKYPLARMLYINVIKKPNRPLPKLQREFIKFVLSKEGQRIVEKGGYMALPAKVAENQRAKIQ